MKTEETRAFAPADGVGDLAQPAPRLHAVGDAEGTGAQGRGLKPLRVHVIGAGAMGADIAGWCVACGMEVTLQDLSEEQIRKGMDAQGKLFAKFRTKALRDAAKARFIADPKGSSIGRADIVIEAIVEKLEVKQIAVQEHRDQAEARRRHGHQHILDHDRGYRCWPG